MPVPEYSVKGHILAMVQCHLVKKRFLEIICIGCAGKSKVPSMNSTLPLGRRTQWMHKALKDRA